MCAVHVGSHASHRRSGPHGRRSNTYGLCDNLHDVGASMYRRHFLKLVAGAAVLAAPRVARAERERTLRYVPVVPLSLLDPVWSANYMTRTHAQMTFDTL